MSPDPIPAAPPARPARRGIAAAMLLSIVALAAPAGPAAAAPRVDLLRVPAGFRVELLTADVPNARQMALGRSADGKQVLYVGSRSAGKVYAVEMDAASGKASAVHVVASGLEAPSGVAWRGGSLYIGALSRILRLDAIDGRLARPPSPVVVTDGLPRETHHGLRFLAFGPDGKLYVPVGAPCNVCELDERHGLIQRMNADGSGVEVVARGVRNSVGFDWSPVDRSLWFTDNGRDNLGDDVPFDELNRLAQAGQHFGFPYCHQGDLADPEFGSQRPCTAFVPPAAKIGPHVATLGMRFYAGTGFPERYRGAVFIAEHGSWNRSQKSGYAVVQVPVDAQGRAGRPEPFLEGFLQGQTAWGRPADVLPLPDGSLLVSDDLAGAIYRVRYAP